MPRKKKAKTQESPATEPTIVGAVLERLPVAEILDRHEEKSPPPPPPEKPSPSEVDTELEPDPLKNGKLSHAAKILAERPAFRPAPEEYFRVSSHEREGIRVFKNTIMKDGQKIGVA